MADTTNNSVRQALEGAMAAADKMVGTTTTNRTAVAPKGATAVAADTAYDPTNSLRLVHAADDPRIVECLGRADAAERIARVLYLSGTADSSPNNPYGLGGAADIEARGLPAVLDDCWEILERDRGLTRGLTATMEAEAMRATIVAEMTEAHPDHEDGPTTECPLCLQGVMATYEAGQELRGIFPWGSGSGSRRTRIVP